MLREDAEIWGLKGWVEDGVKGRGGGGIEFEFVRLRLFRELGAWSDPNETLEMALERFPLPSPDDPPPPSKVVF